MRKHGHHLHTTVRHATRAALLGLVSLLPLSGMAALESLDEAEMSGVSGAGLAFALDDFRWLTKPTSYFEQVGSAPFGDTEFQRGDLRWYGINISGAGTGGFHWDENGSNGFGTACDASSLACPRGGTIADFSPHDNPYVLRAFSPQGIAYDGTPLNQDQNAPNKTIYEYVAPTNQPDYTMSFWGEIEAGRTGGNSDLTVGTGDILKSQTIIRGNAAGSVFRLFQFTEQDNETFAIMYHSHLQGDFRFSAAQATGGGATDVVGIPVRFDNNEGLHFIDVDAYIPLGQLYYQAMTLEAVAPNDGNFILEVPRLRDPSVSHSNSLNGALQHFYSYAVADGPDAGYITARAALLAATPGATPAVTVPETYNVTHGYSRWGDWFPCRGVGCPAVPTTEPTARNEYNDTGSGMFFRKCTGCSDFDAMAYMLTAVDVRRNNNTFNCPGGSSCGGYVPRGSSSNSVANRYYKSTPSCTASSGTDYSCGYGGTYSFDASSDYVANSGNVDPSTFYGVSAGSSSIPVIRTDTVNIGDSRAMGLQVNYMKFTSLGVGN